MIRHVMDDSRGAARFRLILETEWRFVRGWGGGERRMGKGKGGGKPEVDNSGL